MNKKLVVIFLSAAVILLTSGCIIQVNKGGTPAGAANLGGVFMSPDKMETWQSRSTLLTAGGAAASINNADVYFLRFDPSDSKAIYAGTRADGLFYTYNLGAGWQKATALPAGFVRDLAIDSKSKCTLYAAVDQRIYKSADCGRTWKSVWYNADPAKVAAALAVDWYDSSIVYAGIADGTLVKSIDHGASWRVVKKFANRVNKIMLDPRDSRNVFVGVLNEGLYRSTDQGENWSNLAEAMKGYANANGFHDFDLSKSSAGLIVYASKYGMLRSLDNGDTWIDVKLLTQPGAETVYSLAIDPKNANNIYYGTNAAIYKTADVGANWVVKKTPTTRVPSALLVYPDDTKMIFMGAKSVQQ
ncbi:MAG: hypothetical protein V1928_00290 [Parcubacteria group bacterium]